GAAFERLPSGDRQQILDESLQRAQSAPIRQASDLRFVFSQSLRVSEPVLFELATEIAERIHKDRTVVVQLAPILGTAHLSNPSQRLALVEGLLGTEATMSDPDNRSEVLRACLRVAGRPASRAKEAVTSRLEEIRGDQDDPLRDLARELLA
ncbi:MAG TPA: hypothetical protein VJ204_20275, partial [Solirubrobacterales bacterium]|nr:hypothetical protein [Solirubrobacterales bacterium]